MIGLSSLYPWLVIVLLAVPLLLALAAVVYLDGQVLAGDRPDLSRPSRCSCRSRSSRSNGARRSSSRPKTGFDLRGSYLRARTDEQAGVIVYCHEYLSDRWSFHPYLDHLRDLGYDLFTFDFRNHGTSDLDPDYAPLQWTTEHEIHDLRGALAYLRTRDDHDPAGFGLFGVSRGGTTALIVAAAEADVWGVVTDGAFPTRERWSRTSSAGREIYVPSAFLRGLIPMWLFGFPGLERPALDGAVAELPVSQRRSRPWPGWRLGRG